MVAVALIVFREALEAGIIIGIVLAATRGVFRRGRWVAAGVFAGAAGACILAAGAGSLAAAMEGAGQELFNAAVLFAAVAMLTWHNTWMAAHVREHVGETRRVGRAVETGEQPLTALSMVVGLAVLREGAEVVLFLTGIASMDGSGLFDMALGGAVGLGLGVLAAALVYAGLLAIPLHRLFAVTSSLITLLAAGMAAQGVAWLARAGLIDAGQEILWDTSAYLRDDSLTGEVLRVLIGYTDRPTLAQGLTYALVLAMIVAFTTLSRARVAIPEK